MTARAYATNILSSIRTKVLAGERLSFDDGMVLFAHPDFTQVADLAHRVRVEQHGSNTYYVVNRHVNYTNVCVNRCIFCAFRRDDAHQPGAFVLDKDAILARIDAAVGPGSLGHSSLNLDELHIVGGCHPTLPLAWFEDLLSTVQARYPNLMVKAFTAVEIAHFATLEGITTYEVLQRLKAVGLTMLPGGGAEIFDPELRQKICPQKADADTWLRVAGEAHSLGIRTNATMLFGHIESHAQRIDHLCRLRTQQDASKGFTCFIPLPFQTENSALHLPPEATGSQRALDILRTIAVARLMLDNIPHIKAYWVMLGVKLAQVALYCGANDLDGTIVEEHIGRMAGAPNAPNTPDTPNAKNTGNTAMTMTELEHMIRASGFTPVRRDALFGDCVSKIPVVSF